MRTVHGSQLAKAKPTEVDGFKFDSRAEARRYGTLKLMQAAGEVHMLRVHPKLPLVINGRKLGRGYIVMDFAYGEQVDGAWRQVYEDTKGGADTRLAKFRREVAAALHPEIIVKVTQA